MANRRIRLLLAIFTVLFAAMFARAFWLQTVEAAHLQSLATSQHEVTQTIPAGRGTIFDRAGVQLAIGEQKTTIYADPVNVTGNANDANAGTSSGAPIRTTAHLNFLNLLCSLTANSTINYLSDDASGTGLDVSTMNFGAFSFYGQHAGKLSNLPVGATYSI